MEVKHAQTKYPRSLARLHGIGEKLLRQYSGLGKYWINISHVPQDFILGNSKENYKHVAEEPIGAISFVRKRLSLATGMRLYKVAAVEAVVLHEIGHIVLGHENWNKSYPQVCHRGEYEADAWAFTELYIKYGHVPFEATAYLLSFYDHWNFFEPAPTHPSGLNRWDRLHEMGLIPGWHNVATRFGLTTVKENK